MALGLIHSYRIGGRFDAEIRIFDNRGKKICDDDICLTSADPKARILYNAVTLTKKFFQEKLNWDGIDNQGTIAPLKLHWDKKNAAWMCAGNTCEWRFNDAYVHEKVVAHEWTHAVVKYRSPLYDIGESGALNEAVADILAVYSFVYNHGGNLGNPSTWRIEGIRNLAVERKIGDFKALREGEIPNDDNDYGHIHENSRIMSHAHYLAVQILLTKFNGREVYDHTLLIVWKAMSHMDFRETFEGFALKILDVAKKANIHDLTAFTQAYIKVGVILVSVPEPMKQKTYKLVRKPITPAS